MNSTQVNYRRAISAAIADQMRVDESVILIGEDVGVAGGAFKSTPGLYEEFGSVRVRDTPISEQAIIGTALGAAITGLRPIAEIMFADFAGVCFDQIVNQVAKYRYMSNGQLTVPLTIRMANGAGTGFGSQHSQAAENWFLNIPGLKVVVPGTVEDLYSLTRAAIADDNPVLVFEHKGLFSVKGDIPTGEAAIGTLGLADVVRAGDDVTIVATQQMRHRALKAAEILPTRGIQACVIDPRTLVPFDDDTVIESLRTTSRLLVVQEAPPGGSWGASLVSRMVTENFELFDAPPALIGTDETPVPYAGELESAWLPSVDDIVDEAIRLCSY